jgi:hypothetical protein
VAEIELRQIAHAVRSEYVRTPNSNAVQERRTIDNNIEKYWDSGLWKNHPWQAFGHIAEGEE